MWIDDRISQIAIICDLLLGLAVLVTNGKRPSSRAFFLLTLFFAGWIFSIDKALASTHASQAMLWIRATSFFGPLIITGFALLRITIIHYQNQWIGHLWRGRSLDWIGVVGILHQPHAVLLAVCDHQPARQRHCRRSQGDLREWRHHYIPVCIFLLGGSADVASLLIRDQFDRTHRTGLEGSSLQFVALALVTTVMSVERSPAVCEIIINSHR